MECGLDEGHARRSVSDAFPPVGRVRCRSAGISFADEGFDWLDEDDVVDQMEEDVCCDAADACADVQSACSTIDPRWGERAKCRGYFAELWEDIEEEKT